MSQYPSLQCNLTIIHWIPSRYSNLCVGHMREVELSSRFPHHQLCLLYTLQCVPHSSEILKALLNLSNTGCWPTFPAPTLPLAPIVYIHAYIQAAHIHMPPYVSLSWRQTGTGQILLIWRPNINVTFLVEPFLTCPSTPSSREGCFISNTQHSKPFVNIVPSLLSPLTSYCSYLSFL